MKKLLSLTLAGVLALSLAACSSNDGTQSSAPVDSTPPSTESVAPETETAGEPVEVVVFAAASLEASLTEIAGLYAEVAPNVTLTFTFDSSGTLRTQIKEGAVCDLFISASQSQMNELDAEDTTGSNTDGSDFVYSDTRVDFVENKVVLAVPDANPAGIESFSDLATDKLSLLCLGNEDVPVGLLLAGDSGDPGHRHCPVGGGQQGDLCLQRLRGGQPGKGGPGRLRNHLRHRCQHL